MTHEVEKELLDFDDFRPDATPRLPPVLGIEVRVARPSYHNVRLTAVHHATEHSSKAARMIRIAHYDNRLQLPLIAPFWKDRAFVLSTGHGSRDFLDSGDSQESQLSNDAGNGRFVRQTSAHELAVRRRWMVGENGDALSDALVHEVGRLQDTCVACIDGDHDPVRSAKRVVGHQHPARGAQDGLTTGQQHHQEDP
jgi:hypothetical protein